MLRLFIPIFLIGVSIGGFFMLGRPMITEINSLKNQAASFNQALDNSKSLENERDKLVKKYNSINLENLTKLEKMLPDNVDNIRLILEIEKIASPYGMSLKDVKYDTLSKVEVVSDTKTAETPVEKGNVVKPSQSEYGEWDLAFSTEGSYTNFLSFLRDLESNLRIVDIVSIQFTSDAPKTAEKKATSSSSSVTYAPSPSTDKDVYGYTFKIRTYWMKN